jgi:hypothetical protein
VPLKLKGKFYRTAIRLVMLYGAECWPTKRRHVQQLSVTEMRMLRWICGNTRRDRVRNDDIRERLGVAPIEEKLVQHRLRWFGHIQWRSTEAPVRSGVIRRSGNEKQCFQVVRLIAINRPGRSPVHDQQHRLDYVPWSSGRPISRRLIAISRAISLWGRSEC